MCRTNTTNGTNTFYCSCVLSMMKKNVVCWHVKWCSHNNCVNILMLKRWNPIFHKISFPFSGGDGARLISKFSLKICWLWRLTHIIHIIDLILKTIESALMHRNTEDRQSHISLQNRLNQIKLFCGPAPSFEPLQLDVPLLCLCF